MKKSSLVAISSFKALQHCFQSSQSCGVWQVGRKGDVTTYTWYIAIPSSTCVIITLLKIQCINIEAGRCVGGQASGGGKRPCHGAQIGTLNVGRQVSGQVGMGGEGKKFPKKNPFGVREGKKKINLSSPPYVPRTWRNEKGTPINASSIHIGVLVGGGCQLTLVSVHPTNFSIQNHFWPNLVRQGYCVDNHYRVQSLQGILPPRNYVR